MQPQAISLSQMQKAPTKMKNNRADLQDPLLEANLGTQDNFITSLLQEDVKKDLIKLFTSYKDCFFWDYHELPRLDRDLVKHCLLIKPNFKPYQ